MPSWVFRESRIFSHGYFVGLEFFLVGFSWVRNFCLRAFRGFGIFSRGYFVSSLLFLMTKTTKKTHFGRFRVSSTSKNASLLGLTTFPKLLVPRRRAYYMTLRFLTMNNMELFQVLNSFSRNLIEEAFSLNYASVLNTNVLSQLKMALSLVLLATKIRDLV